MDGGGTTVTPPTPVGRTPLRGTQGRSRIGRGRGPLPPIPTKTTATTTTTTTTRPSPLPTPSFTFSPASTGGPPPPPPPPPGQKTKKVELCFEGEKTPSEECLQVKTGGFSKDQLTGQIAELEAKMKILKGLIEQGNTVLERRDSLESLITREKEGPESLADKKAYLDDQKAMKKMLEGPGPYRYEKVEGGVTKRGRVIPRERWTIQDTDTQKELKDLTLKDNLRACKEKIEMLERVIPQEEERVKSYRHEIETIEKSTVLGIPFNDLHPLILKKQQTLQSWQTRLSNRQRALQGGSSNATRGSTVDSPRPTREYDDDIAECRAGKDAFAIESRAGLIAAQRGVRAVI